MLTKQMWECFLQSDTYKLVSHLSQPYYSTESETVTATKWTIFKYLTTIRTKSAKISRR